MEQRKRPEITLDLINWLETFVGLNEHRDLESFSYLSEVIEIKLKGTQLFKIVKYPNEEHFDWNGCHIWRWTSYESDYSKWKTDRELAERRRVEKYIFDENIRRLTNRVMKEFCINEENAIRVAINTIRKKSKVIKTTNYKVIEKVEEI